MRWFVNISLNYGCQTMVPIADAVCSPCRKWRYALFRRWDKRGPKAMFIGLNPSTATEIHDDPTVRRCALFAKRWGYGSLIMANIFAYRATYPNEMKAQEDPVGPMNDFYLTELSMTANIVVAAWGAHGSFRDRGIQVARLIPRMKCLGMTKDGHPKHPLYLKYTESLMEYEYK